MYHTLAYSYMLNPLIQYTCKQTTHILKGVPMRECSNFTTMTMQIALALCIEDADLEHDDFEITQIAENDFNVASISNDPYDAFDFNVRIYIDPVFCAITYDIYRSFYGDTTKYTITDITYKHVA